MTIVTTGQITIIDQNDARPISWSMAANPSPQQVYSKDESAISYSPDWTTVNSNLGLLLTPKVYLGGVGAAVDITAQLSNPKWSVDMGTAITGTAAAISGTPLAAAFVGTGTVTAVATQGTQPTLRIKANFLDTVQQAVIYFEGDYTDPVTGLTSHIVTQLTLGMVKTGTNAVYAVWRGQNVIENATGTTKTVVAIAVDLIRAAGVDTSGVTYRFFEANGATQVITGASFNTKYGLKTVAYGTAPTGTGADIGVNLPASGAWSANNTLVINELAVADMGNYRCEAKDADGTIYQVYFPVYDISDPYQLNVLSSTGDKLQNGQGSTSLTPDVFYGAARVPDISAWTFTWTFWNKDGKRGAFIDTTRTAVAQGRGITAHTTGTSATFTYGGGNITGIVAGDIIKVVTAAGVEKFYEVLSNAASVITIRTPVSNTWLNYTDFPAPATNEFSGGSLFICRPTGGQQVTTGATPVVLTGYEVDAKARITCDANRP